MIRKLCFIALAAIVFLLAACQPKLLRKAPVYDYGGMTKKEIKIHKKVEKFLLLSAQKEKPVKIFPGTRIDSIRLDEKNKRIGVFLNKRFSFVPFREETVRQIYQTLKKELGRKYRKYDLTVYSLEVPIEELVPNYFRPDVERYDESRLPKKYERPPAVVRELKPWQAPQGLENRNIVVWNSHGWYYNRKIGRWEWQRPRLFQTVEDLLPTSFVLPYLVPMLENAGAQVFLPRERDIQIHEVIVDNDSTPESGRHYSETTFDNRHFWQTGDEPGFAVGNPPYSKGQNPFRQGTFRWVKSDTLLSARAQWVPDIPHTGNYAVYVSYHSDSNAVYDAQYTVFHSGGQTRFLVNQQIGGGTWLYLGTFKFKKGLHPDSGSVVLSNKSSEAEKIVSADAVRFGGGMGNVARDNTVSGRPRFEEGARYYLQYAGFPDSLVYNLNGDTNDYRDDYQSRAEFANYLYGKPFGPNGHRDVKGLGIPIDLSLAFHTDAGFTGGDTTIGTLAIYSLVGADTERVFPDSVSRLANRDFADILQTQIVRDINAEFDSTWQRRALREAQYSEAFRPNVPAALLELLSHQNFRDMQLALDPRFRFTVSRSIYKAMLKFINSEYKKPYRVQPLPVTHFQATFDSLNRVVLKWQPQPDPLEPTADPDAYIVYTRIDSGGFDNGFIVSEPQAIIDSLAPGKIYSFKVCALNAGGKSFPSEILAVYRSDNPEPPVLIVNGFDRISGPTYFRVDSVGGFLSWEDNGVPDRFDLNFTGMQYDLKLNSPFRSNDAPGFGASFADFETKITPGNTFDFVYEHGKSVKAAGFSFVSSSDEAVMDKKIDLKNYRIMDLILGEEKRTPLPFTSSKQPNDSAFAAFPVRLQRAIRSFLIDGKALFVSGAYVGTDLFAGRDSKHPDVVFGKKWLRIEWVNNHASRTGTVQKAFRDSTFDLPDFKFNTTYHPKIYTVEAPDAINPMSDSWTWLRYSENRFSAAVAFKGVFKCVVMGFPFETILKRSVRDKMMRQILEFFSKDRNY